MTLEQLLDNIYPLPTSSKSKITSIVRERSLQKGHILLEADKLESKVYFLKRGIVRAFTTSDDGEVTFWFGEKGDTIMSMLNYVEQVKSYENIELITDCELFEISLKELNYHYQTDIHIANLGRKLAEKEMIKLEQRFISRQVLSAKERYIQLITNQPSLIQSVPLKFIASYLGITQASLSRVRKEI